MARVSLIALLAFSLFNVAQANPVDAQAALIAQDAPVHTTAGWGWDNCGAR